MLKKIFGFTSKKNLKEKEIKENLRLTKEVTINTKVISEMSYEEETEYAEKWKYYQIEVMKGFAAALSILYEMELTSEDFDDDINNILFDTSLAGDIILDIYELFDLEIELVETTAIYEVAKTLFDVVLLISDELVKKELGYDITVKV